ncbi:hypothetical protein M9H77_29871 [Catharanthus roseus]|uniref:Uncharacterized protein n=1 Tax=Catharanthus roseus TaxID=4058 RepID=A0ACB9ZWF5_CATRO|nr:hypothetical protein M9H77_29871 [Catharanthus roseus]
MYGLLSIISMLKCSESITGKRSSIQTCQHHRGPLLLVKHHHRSLLDVLLLNIRPSKNLSSWLSYHHISNLSLGLFISPQACISSYQDRRAAQCKFRVSLE